MDPELERIRSYLVAQASEKSVEELIERVREGVRDLEASARAIDPAHYSEVAPGESWTPRACLEHITGSNTVNASQILHVAWTGALPEPEEPDVSGDPADLLASHAEAIESLFVHVLEADPEANLDERWEHPMFGDLNWREWLIFLRIHCRDHARQLGAMQEAFSST